MMRLGSRGAVLLEAVIALAVLATVGSAAAVSASESIRAVNRAHEREDEIRRAGRLLTAVSLWTHDDLDRHLGSTRQGPWWLRIDRVMPALYTVQLADSLSGGVLLRTTLLRWEANQ